MEKKSKDENSFSDKLKSWIIVHIKTIVISLAVFLAVVIAIVLIIRATYINSLSKTQRLNDKLTAEYNIIEDKFNNIKNSNDEQKDYSDVISDLNSYITDTTSWANLRAVYLRATAKYNSNDFKGAYDDYKFIDDSVKDEHHYLKYLSSFGCAACLEAQNDLEGAKSLYVNIWDKYGLDCPISDRALLGALRISNKYQLSDEVQKYALLISDNYPSSEYGSYAKSFLPAPDTSTENIGESFIENAEN